MCHTYLNHVENVLLNHWHNNTDSAQQYTLECISQCIAHSGAELGDSVNLRAAFTGMTVGTGVEEKTFVIAETTAPTKCPLHITVSPNSDLWLYQRRYEFHTKMTWVLDAWGELCNVGSQGGNHIQEGTCVSHIYAQDFVTTKIKLTGEQSVAWPSKTWDDLKLFWGRRADRTRKWGELTEKGKSALEKIGLNGSQQA